MGPEFQSYLAEYEIGEFNSLIWNVCLVIFVLTFSLVWICKKANKPMWAPLVPFFNFVTLFQIVGLSPIYILFLLLPGFNIVGMIIMLWIFPVRLAHSFGRSTTFGIGLILFPIIFYPILSFSTSAYIGPNGNRKKIEEESDEKLEEDGNKQTNLQQAESENKELEKPQQGTKITCPHCGVKLESGSKKCFLCGRIIR